MPVQPYLMPAAIFLFAGFSLPPAPLSASEIGATHLVYEKAVKMKKADVTLLLSFADQSRPSDTLLRPRALNCLVIARGKSGPLPAKGKLVLQVLGSRLSAPWESRAVSATAEDGAASFNADDILGLVDEATADGANPELFRIRFDGGKGKKVSSLTMDCLHEDGEA